MFVTPTWMEVAALGNTSRHRGRHLHERLRAEQDLLALLRKCEACVITASMVLVFACLRRHLTRSKRPYTNLMIMQKRAETNRLTLSIPGLHCLGHAHGCLGWCAAALGRSRAADLLRRGIS